MPTRPRAKVGRHMLPGLAAAALFVVMATVFMRAELPADLLDSVGFDGSVMSSIGYALFDLTGTMEGNVDGVVASDGFLAAFEIIDLMLARREEGGSLRTAIADGGRQLVGAGDAETNDAETNDVVTDESEIDDAMIDDEMIDNPKVDDADGGDA
jgi:NADH-quinone oxidoreductase subunit J